MKLTSDGAGVLGGLTLRIVEVSWNGDDGVGDCVAEISFSRLLHFGQNHGRDLFRVEGLLFILVLDFDLWFGAVVDDLEWPMLHVGLDIGVVEFAPDQAFGV